MSNRRSEAEKITFFIEGEQPIDLPRCIFAAATVVLAFFATVYAIAFLVNALN